MNLFQGLPATAAGNNGGVEKKPINSVKIATKGGNHNVALDLNAEIHINTSKDSERLTTSIRSDQQKGGKKDGRAKDRGTT